MYGCNISWSKEVISKLQASNIGENNLQWDHLGRVESDHVRLENQAALFELFQFMVVSITLHASFRYSTHITHE